MTTMTAAVLSRGLLDGPGPSFDDHLAVHGPLPVVGHDLSDDHGAVAQPDFDNPSGWGLRERACRQSAQYRDRKHQRKKDSPHGIGSMLTIRPARRGVLKRQ